MLCLPFYVNQMNCSIIAQRLFDKVLGLALPFSCLIAHPADHQLPCWVASLFVFAGFSISFDCFTSILTLIRDQLTGSLGRQGFQIDWASQMQSELMKLGIIYWTSDDCDGQVDLKLHLSVGQVILFPYFDHCILQH